MKQRNRTQILLSWILAAILTFSMTGNATAAGNVENDTGNTVWAKDTPVSSKELAAPERVPEETEEFAEDETVRVIIAFDGKSAVDAGYSTENIAKNRSAVRYEDKLESSQEKISDQISEEALNGQELEVRYNFTLLANAVSADVAYGEVEKIQEVDGVSGVYVVPQYEPAAADAVNPNTVTAGQMVGSYNTWASGYTGAGQRIAVIDTGLDTDHPSFDAGAFDYSLAETAENAGVQVSDYTLLDENEIASVLDTLNAKSMDQGLTAEQLYRNSKVGYAFNYVDKGLDVTHDNDSQGDHGTHVSGISTANLYVPGQDGYARQKSGVVGIAPDAQLLVMKVFGAAGGAYPDDYMAAIEDAIRLDADAVNLSLGSPNAGESKEYASAEQYINEIFDKLQETETVVSISAGNAGGWAGNSTYGANLTGDVNMDTVGSPGSYTNAFTVASANNSGYTGYGVRVGDADIFYLDGSNDGVDMAAFRTLDTQGTGTTYDYVFLDGVGKAEDFQGLDVEGKIVLIKRGEMNFSEKHMNASAAGAAGVLIYNNEPGTINLSVSGSASRVPCASITQADAAIIRDKSTKESEGVYSGQMIVSEEVATDYNVPDGYTMSDFSSWGVPGNLSMKPEITAPGGNIYSTVNNGEYGQMSGTSMASPSIAGMSALAAEYIKANNLEEKTGQSIRALTQSLLMSTAVPLEQAEGVEYSPRKQGAGLANIEDATKSQVYIMMDKNGADGKVKAELGDDPDKTGTYSFGFTLYNMSDTLQYYETDSSVLTEEILEDSYIAGTSRKLSPKVEFASSGKGKLYDLNSDGKVDEADAEVMLKVANGSAASKKVTQAESPFDFNSDGVVDTADVYDFLQEIRGVTDKADLQKEVITVDDSTQVSVKVTLSEDDRAYLDQFPNGMYVDGFIYLNGKVQLSVPMLAFYGNWADSSMFEPYDYLKAANGQGEEVWPAYSGVEKTNYLGYQFAGDNGTYIYNSNMYTADGQYLPERNAISSETGDKISGIYYTLIRNASNVTAAVTDAATGQVYQEVRKGAVDAAYYSDSAAAWKNTTASAELNWAGTDAAGKPLKDGTKVNIAVTALPSYYDNRSGNDQPGAGVSFTVPMTIDNTDPEVVSVNDAAADKIEVKVKDNRYVAAVAVLKRDKTTMLKSYAVNQTAAGAESTVAVDIPAESGVFYVAAVDYAGNMNMVRVNKSGEPDVEFTDGVTLNESSIELLKGTSQRLTATVGPESILDDTVTWKSSNPEIASVNDNGVVTAVKQGNADITVATNAVNASGQHETAVCTVTVKELDVTLNGILWDETSSVFWTSFHSNDTVNYVKNSGKQTISYMSATPVGDKILAATYDESQSSDLYLVDPSNGYAAQKKTNLPWCTDLAYSPKMGIAVGTYGPYVQVINAKQCSSMGNLNFSAETAGKHLVGVTYAGWDAQSQIDCYYAVDQAGILYLIGLMSAGEGIDAAIAPIQNLGVDTKNEWYFNSLYYDIDSGYLFWSLFDGEKSALYAINEANFACSLLGEFPENVYPVSGLYTDADITAVSDSTKARAKSLQKSGKQVTITGELPNLLAGTVK